MTSACKSFVMKCALQTLLLLCLIVKSGCFVQVAKSRCTMLNQEINKKMKLDY